MISTLQNYTHQVKNTKIGVSEVQNGMKKKKKARHIFSGIPFYDAVGCLKRSFEI
jgi:hypothetical protein